MNRRLNLDIPQNNTFLLPRDILAVADRLIRIKFGMGTLDDMNHLKNKRIRSVADLLQEQFGLALVRLENMARGNIYVALKHNWIPTPQNLVNSTNSHYGRICPIDTSEGINVGLIGSLAIHARIGRWGSLESPFYKISERSKGARMLYLSPGRDEYYMVAAGNSLALNQGIQEEQVVPARYRQEFLTIAWEQSLSDVIEGKEGRVRETLLGKRVDYSGRSVIVVGPSLALHRCGLPREIAIELFQEFGFNADFDGDQMPVHVPLSAEAQSEARLLMFSNMNLLSPTIGDPISAPTQDMLSGLYVLTSGNRRGYTSHILDEVKTLGFREATTASISLGIDDLLTIPSKRWLVQDAEQQSFILEKHHHYGNVHAVEKLRQSIEIWYATSEYLRQEMTPNFRMTDPFNPVHIMSFSGAKGNASQVHQLVGMRGLMSDPQGQMIDLPIQSNLREGVSLTEYIISCYGARKGVVDTAIRTSDAGYLTRRLVEVVQHIVVRRTDCGTIRAHDDLVQLGEAVGIIAGQSIGEPGTQLTLRTFHTGGVFTGGTAEHVRAPSNGKIKFNEDLVHPTRTRHGHPAFLCSRDLYVTIESEDIIHNVYIPPKSFLLVQNDQYVESEQVIAKIRARTSTLNLKEKVRKHIYSDSEGEMHWNTDVYHAPEFTYGDRIPDYSELNRITCTGRCNLRYPAILDGNSDLLAKRRRNRFIIPLESIQEGENQRIPSSGISIEIPRNGILRIYSILAYFDDPRYIRKSLGLTKYETRELNSIINEEDLIEYRGVKV
ncbi:hypothetical protein L6452_39284 [Arctium lappa]|uniref:Uncharacterized protein n=1 Tax=Arctium lappa TaxID=4217 RepID=A0ACB8XRW6_ARCLA|nr:hypothetical protein L6452_39284 [Arctium lappa]